MSRNGYSYAHGNPVNWTDPSGKFIQALLPFLLSPVGLVIGGVATLVAATVWMHTVWNNQAIRQVCQSLGTSVEERLKNIFNQPIGSPHESIQPAPTPLTPGGTDLMTPTPVGQVPPPVTPPPLPTVTSPGTPMPPLTPGGTTLITPTAGSNITAASGPWTSSDPYVADLANDIHAAYGNVIAVNRRVIDPATGNDITDIDIETTNAIIEVKSRSLSGIEKPFEKVSNAVNWKDET